MRSHILLLCLAAAVAAHAPLLADTTTAATPATPRAADERQVQAHTQTLLARAGFSPGLIDGRPGRKTKLAIQAFQRSRNLTETGSMDQPTRDALAAEDPLAASGTWTHSYTITQSDSDQVTGPIPEDWLERSKLAFSGYADMTELLAERSWSSTELVSLLNPGIALNDLKIGDQVTLPDVTSRPLPSIARLQITLKEQLVMGYDSTDRLVMLTHCSIARLPEKRPLGAFHVTVVVTDPDYTFDPKDWPEVTGIASKLRIAPGPRTPVGSAWIGLDKPGIGMHGTVRPQDIGKTGSHGCFRLYNWEAQRLAHAVKISMPVQIDP